MKTLSLKQPWAELILQGKKKIELRRWNTKFRGTFYIHASGNIDEEMMKKYNFKELPRQSVVGKVTLVDVKKYDNEDEFLKDSDKHLASSMEWGSYGFILENPERIKEFKCKGKLGFFDVVL
jgi:predicted transcriptional regulator